MTRSILIHTFIYLLLLVIFNTSVNAEEWEHVPTIEKEDGLKTLEVVPFGILLGEYRDAGDYNGMYLSRDNGETWDQIGLAGRKISDIAFDNGAIYVATHDTIDQQNGLFISKDEGQTWIHPSGVDFSSFSVAADGNNIGFGTGSHGLWMSFDGGETFEQVIGDGWFGPNVKELTFTDSVYLASLLGRVYTSYDKGHTWESEQYPDINTWYIDAQDNIAIAASLGRGGTYRSNDYGHTWSLIYEDDDSVGSAITHCGNIFFMGFNENHELNGQKSIYKSYDRGKTWIDMNYDLTQDSSNARDIECLNTSPITLLIVTQKDGIYKTYVEDRVQEDGFLDIPWQYNSENELIDKITSVFDHEYPLLGYSYHTEPEEASNTTVNYLGEEKSIPDLYYSGHNGYDFALPIDTDVIAPYSGYASYYYCSDCGNTIKIDHQNGYQSVFMHLQSEGLITTGTPIWVEKGTVIGKVGMTGKTTGPHLHFTIVKDTDNDGSFEDEFPWGETDPFGWQNTHLYDPWEVYTWTDIFGSHEGTQSNYLWNSGVSQNEQYFLEEQTTTIQNENKKITVTKMQEENPFKVLIKNNIKPVLTDIQDTLKYISNTSLIIKMTNNVGQELSQLHTESNIEIDFSDSDLSNIVLESIKIYVLNEITGIWEPLPTQILDLIDKKIISNTNHFSEFAVFGDKIDNLPSETIIDIQGDIPNEWYITYPTISFITSKENTKIYYLIGNNIDWVEYTQPFNIEQEGTFGIQYMSIDQNGNVENTKDILIRIDTQNKFKHINRVIDTKFGLINNTSPN